MTKKSVPPSITKTAFDCPFCSAFTTQYWFDVFANKILINPFANKTSETPIISYENLRKKIETDKFTLDVKEKHLKDIKELENGLLQLNYLSNSEGKNCNYRTDNLFLSQCYHCKKVAIWVHKTLIYPPEKVGAHPNTDLPEEIVQDFEEARSILNLSPRGAAALLRLCVQKLCRFLNEEGKDLNTDIENLVLKGLDPILQRSLDIVRVIGNEAVHPGVMDLKDDRDTALKLFEIINNIADRMITIPKNTNQLYESLPESKRQQIENRNEKTLLKKE